jgi:hypothetical protein
LHFRLYRGVLHGSQVALFSFPSRSRVNTVSYSSLTENPTGTAKGNLLSDSAPV